MPSLCQAYPSLPYRAAAARATERILRSPRLARTTAGQAKGWPFDRPSEHPSNRVCLTSTEVRQFHLTHCIRSTISQVLLSSQVRDQVYLKRRTGIGLRSEPPSDPTQCRYQDADQ